MVGDLQVAERDKSSSMGEQMSHWLDQVLGPTFQHYGHSDTWKPAMNLCEFPEHYCLVVELAGMQAPAIDLRIEGGVLVVTGSRGTPVDPQAKGPMRLHLMEIDHGSFRREVKLPDDVNVDAIEASYRGGYLWVRIPRKSRG